MGLLQTGKRWSRGRVGLGLYSIFNHFVTIAKLNFIGILSLNCVYFLFVDHMKRRMDSILTH